MSTEEVMRNLEAMEKYFSYCMINAPDGSEAEKRFLDYCESLRIAWDAMNRMEDDGK